MHSANDAAVNWREGTAMKALAKTDLFVEHPVECRLHIAHHLHGVWQSRRSTDSRP